MRISPLQPSRNHNPQHGGGVLPGIEPYLRTFSFFFLCFSLDFFLRGVLVGVGDGVPEISGFGVGRTRGWSITA
jgi:hypothetical protein